MMRSPEGGPPSPKDIEFRKKTGGMAIESQMISKSMYSVKKYLLRSGGHFVPHNDIPSRVRSLPLLGKLQREPELHGGTEGLK